MKEAKNNTAINIGKLCMCCGVFMMPKIFPSGGKEGAKKFADRKFCSTSCSSTWNTEENGKKTTGAERLRKEAAARGDKTYFTGKPCRRGHIAARTVSTGNCVECRKATHAIRMKNPDAQAHYKYVKRTYQKQWREQNIDTRRAYEREWDAQNKDKVSAKSKRWRDKNLDRAREKSRLFIRKYREEYPEKIKASYLAWKKSNPDYVRISSATRKARQRSAEGKFTKKDINNIRDMQNDKCAYCNTKLNGGGHLDHITPLSKGGSNWPKNLQITCVTCNLKKYNSDPIEFAQRIGRLI